METTKRLGMLQHTAYGRLNENKKKAYGIDASELNSIENVILVE